MAHGCNFGRSRGHLLSRMPTAAPAVAGLPRPMFADGSRVSVAARQSRGVGESKLFLRAGHVHREWTCYCSRVPQLSVARTNLLGTN